MGSVPNCWWTHCGDSQSSLEGSMSDQKRPFHEVLSQKLIIVPVGITSDLASAKAAEVMTILDTLYKGKMPAAAAHEIAEFHAGLPTLLADSGQKYLAEFAEEVLDDLKGREDKKKQEEQPATPAELSDN